MIFVIAVPDQRPICYPPLIWEKQHLTLTQNCLLPFTKQNQVHHMQNAMMLVEVFVEIPQPTAIIQFPAIVTLV